MSISVDLPTDFSFDETHNAHGWKQLLPFHFDTSSGSLYRIERLQGGEVVQICFKQIDGILNVTVNPPINHPDPQEEIRSKIRLMFQLDLPIREFHHYCSITNKLTDIPLKRQGRMLCSPTVWEDCCKVILTTNTTWAQTIGMTKRLVDTYGEPWQANPTLKSFPTPQRISSIAYSQFETEARFGYRNQSVHSLAVAITSGEIDLEEYRDPTIPAIELRKRLLALKGVGPYAASCLMIYLGRYDTVNVDSWARMMVSKELGRAVTGKEVHQFFEQYGKWRGLVYHYYPWSHNT